MNKFDLKKKVAIVTGGAQGFGLDITKRFIKSGAKVIIWDNDENELKKIINKIKNKNLFKQIVDVTDPDNVEDAVSKIIKNMNDGKYVDDGIVNNLLEKIIFDSQKKNKLIFDGYPRTINQAKTLNNLLIKSNQKIDFIFFLNVNKNAIIKRIEKRKILEKRSDDDASTILKRYDTYMQVTKPVLDYYSKNENFHEVDGSMEINDISQKIEQILKV